MPVHLLFAFVLCATGARAQDLSAFPALRDALLDGDIAARVDAAFSLGQFGLVDVSSGEAAPMLGMTLKAAVQALAPAVSDADPLVRRAAVEALGKVGGEDVDSFLLAATTDAEADVRGEAALALFRRRYLKRVPEYSTATMLRLSALAADVQAEVRWRAVYALAYWPETRARTVLKAAQSDGDSRTRLFAARGLGKLAVAPDSALLSDQNLFVRAEAVAAFAAAKVPEQIPDSLFADLSAHVRAAAADAAASASRLPALEQLAGEPGTLAAGRALVAIARLQRAAAAGRVDRAAKDPRWWIRVSAVEAAGFVPDAVDRRWAALADPDPRVASHALETLSASSAPFVVSALDKALRDPTSALELRGAAIDAAGERADPALIDALAAAKPFAVGAGSGELREGIISALKSTRAKHPETAAVVAQALKNFPEFTDKPRRFKALKAAAAVLFETDRGNFTVELSTGEAPMHVAAFAESVKRKFYDGLTWHRVVTAFVVQGGDPRGSGWGDAGWRLADEPTRLSFARGTVGMPKAGKDTGGCQLFVSLVPTPHLDGRYTAFGRVVSGMDVLDRLEPGDKIVRATLRLP